MIMGCIFRPTLCKFQCHLRCDIQIDILALKNNPFFFVLPGTCLIIQGKYHGIKNCCFTGPCISCDQKQILGWFCKINDCFFSIRTKGLHCQSDWFHLYTPFTVLITSCRMLSSSSSISPKNNRHISIGSLAGSISWLSVLLRSSFCSRRISSK